jgi:hypothetical protein
LNDPHAKPFLDIAELATYTTPFGDGYPAIKITAQSASVVGGVAGASSTVCNSPRMQLDCNALHDGRCPSV